ncbi:hypothetical protein FJZ19_03535 [Candidatus Pacearchaeota archaeon]|nr:hypothetical protein [Candidatus Pacearchaeota archaeon]
MIKKLSPERKAMQDAVGYLGRLEITLRTLDNKKANQREQSKINDLSARIRGLVVISWVYGGKVTYEVYHKILCSFDKAAQVVGGRYREDVMARLEDLKKTGGRYQPELVG